MAMDGPSCRLLSWITCLAAFVVLEAIVPAHSWCTPNPSPKHEARFKQKTNKFWEYQEQSNTWVEISVPFDLMSCINGTCTKVGSIKQLARKPGHDPPVHSLEEEDTKLQEDGAEDTNDPVLPIRKRISLTRMSESSVWVTGQSGSIYERFWNGEMWVIAPHELPTSAGYATATFIVNTTILALSEAGILYQLQLNEHAQPIWTEMTFNSGQQFTNLGLRTQSQAMRIRNGIASNDGRKLFLSIMNGSLLEVTEIQPLRWNYHGRPPGADVSYISDAGNLRPGTLFTVSSTGDLYEFDKETKPSWKKHIWSEELTKNISLRSSAGCALHGLSGSNSVSLFLITKVALRKFKWKDCHSPPDTKIAFIVDQEVFRRNIIFVVGRNGRLYQYNRVTELWHRHYQSPHLVLSRTPGTAMRPSPLSLAGSLFMVSEHGGLVEYHFSPKDGWEWVEHGTPHRDVTLVGAPGPCFDGSQLFLVGSDGHVYRRHMEGRTWRWTSHGHPPSEPVAVDEQSCATPGTGAGADAHYTDGFRGSCDGKVAAVRPVPFSEDAVVFELRDGRLAELRRPPSAEGCGGWEWARIIGTPASACMTSYWTAVAT